MKINPICSSLIMLLTLCVASTAVAQDSPVLAAISKLIDSAKFVEAPVFAPKAFAKAESKFADAQTAVRIKRDQKTIDGYVTEAREFVETALKATEVGKLSLKEYLAPRDKAKTANAAELVPTLWTEAEWQFAKATSRVENGDVKGGLKEADKATPFFDKAEMEAIRKQILGNADDLIAKAVLDDAGKFALTTLDKSRSAREKGNDILTADRYNRSTAVEEARRAEYEARHASTIALTVRSLNKNDQAWEKLMLVYEIQIDRIGQAMKTQLPLDNGPAAATDSIISHLKRLESTSSTLASDLASQTGAKDDAEREVIAKLQSVLSKLTPSWIEGDATALAGVVDQYVVSLIEQKDSLARQNEDLRARSMAMSRENASVAAELEQKQASEEKLATAKRMFDPTEGEVFINATNDIVLRLHGLSFGAGKSDLTEDHMPLLEKVKQTVELFPNARLVIEGHTDNKGDLAANMSLSEKRAYAVMQYLRQTIGISSDKVSAIGFGSEKPVATNDTPDGRAKNRRIDILIMP